MKDKDDWKQVLVIRKDLKMRRGKEAAQAAHASLEALLSMGDFAKCAQVWFDTGTTKICVGVNSETELDEVYTKAASACLPRSLITDEGRTEFGGIPTKTAVAIGPAKASAIDVITGHLKLL